jgi:flagellin
MAQRILTLATQGANGTMGTSDKTAIRQEMRQLMAAIQTIDGRTKFSGNSLLGRTTDISLQVSNTTTDVITLSSTGFTTIGTTGTVAQILTNADQTTEVYTGTSYADLLIEEINGDTDTNITNVVFNSIQTRASDYIASLSTQRSLLGAYQNQIEFTVSNVTELSSNLSAARSNVQDTDYASETASLTKGQILQQAATAMLAQANQMPNVILSLLK